MNIIRTDIPEVFIVEPKVFSDSRGHFLETYNQKKYSDLGLPEMFVQDNESISVKGVVRGLHLQVPPFAQGKLVRVVSGTILDVAVDCRPYSKTFGKYISVVLSDKNKWQLWIPRGFAHGFSTLTSSVIFNYKCDNFYSKDCEIGIKFDDDALSIDWKTPISNVSEKDRINIPFSQVKQQLENYRFEQVMT